MLATQNPLSAKSVLVIVCGNVLEWYDFAIYGYFVSLIADQFFPAGDRTAALLAAFGVFALGFIGRVGGGLMYGMIADLAGRSHALRISVLLMAVSTTLMGLLPGYATLGALAPVLLTLLRLLQGLSVGGEFTTSITFLAERAAAGRRGLTSGLVGAAAATGFVLGSAVGALLSRVLTAAQLAEWGWRVPFLSGSLLGIIALLMRRHLVDLTEPPATRMPARRLLHALVQERLPLLRTVLGIAPYMVGFYLPFVYLATGLQKRGLLGMQGALMATMLSMVGLGLLSPIAGWLADRSGTRRLLTISSVLLALLTAPLLRWAEMGGFWRIMLAMALLVIMYAPLNAVAMPFLSLQFSSAFRGTGFSVAFNFASAAFGGLAPLAADLILNQTGSLAATGLLITATGLLSIYAWQSGPAEEPAPAAGSAALRRDPIAGS